ncbi:hypothetical protein GOBAR_AA33509 [Gossypium barbadense]|uniref:Uncharacterized protein n=1 Tax=Gossypium barbadense TaxID=3634 RepID=A0A2P5W7X3_GOSBA|nr:hypothetical protein GOBAR_AA33509 [Gossypium barbadense]
MKLWTPLTSPTNLSVAALDKHTLRGEQYPADMPPESVAVGATSMRYLEEKWRLLRALLKPEGGAAVASPIPLVSARRGRIVPAKELKRNSNSSGPNAPTRNASKKRILSRGPRTSARATSPAMVQPSGHKWPISIAQKKPWPSCDPRRGIDSGEAFFFTVIRDINPAIELIASVFQNNPASIYPARNPSVSISKNFYSCLAKVP